jgi:hypothetical protein
MHTQKHSEETKKRMSENKLKQFAQTPMSQEWKEKIRETNKVSYARMRKVYEIETYGWGYLEQKHGKVFMKNTYGTDYQTKYHKESNM